MTSILVAQRIIETDPVQLRTAAGEVVPVRAKSLEVLRVLAVRPGEVVSREALLNEAWPDSLATDESLTQCIRELRGAFGANGKEVIQTMYRRGYRLNTAQATQIASAPPQFPDFKQDVDRAISEDGTEICFAVAGSGPVIVRAPHWMTHIDYDWRSEIYGPQLCGFAEELTLVRFDARGTGLSQRNVGPGGVDEWVADMRAVMQATGFKRYSLLGNSGGAQTVVKYAAIYPDEVSSVVLLGAVGRGSLHRGVSPEHVAAFSQLIRDGWARDNPAFRQLMTTGLWPDASTRVLAGFNELQRLSSDAEIAAQLLANIAATTVEPYYPLVKAPTLLLHSLRDGRVPFAESELAAQCILNAKLHPLESNNHTPVWSEPAFAEMMSAIIKFVSKHSAEG